MLYSGPGLSNYKFICVHLILNFMLTFCFIGLPTMRSLWTMAHGKSRRAQDSVFAQEQDPKLGKKNKKNNNKQTEKQKNTTLHL